ncbi:fungal-specific transcription factor domain-containing protein [Talaromyces proteolyticus]|uniref:Fungal-specific transcription factor domain-containing protein n=1 Tax=Talaromyces proteolyticus TaxID=1131652 RepID=A0AAD4L247_9EURO|nr:fungal-specific transcription factor domain-containing protein [Talaromyces proteolyticus]KAH8705764.1 fungal-specific transcription factor domain-containing protein [Talaromyces proteolyticus]
MAQPGDVRLINAGFWDIELHNYLSSSSGMHGYNYTSHPILPPSLPQTPWELEKSDTGLLDYFQSVAFNSLAAFGQDRQELRDILLRLALSNCSSASNAVLQATLAYSSLHRYGLKMEAAQLKLRAIQELESASQNGIDVVEGIQHMAAGMILCYFEIEDIDATSIQWLWYVCGSKHLMEAIDAADHPRATEFSIIGDWVDYHVVVGQFSIRHWHKMSLDDVYSQHYSSALAERPRVCQKKPIEGVASCSHEILRLLYELFKTTLKPSDPGYHTREYTQSLKSLGERIRGVQTNINSSRGAPQNDIEPHATVVELYKLASLIYLERVSSNFSGQSNMISSHAERAFQLLETIKDGQVPFPLFVLGCEAKTEGRRILILDLIEKAGKISRSRSLAGLHRMVQAAWTQDDLVEHDNDLDYVLKLDAIITSNNIIPTFA